MMLTGTIKDEKTTSSLLLATMDQPCRRFSMSELNSATDNFDEKWCIGNGGSGKVYKGVISEGPNNTYAIKRLHFMSDQGEPEFWAEVEMLSRLRHCNLVSLIGYCKEEKEMALVYEYMPDGTLYDHLHKKRTHLTWSQRLQICLGAARGLDYLHTGTGTQQGVIHRDVKTSNILLDQNYAAKIADFGLAKIGPTDQTQTYVSTIVKGTFGYMDPSYFYTGRLTRKSDVYAFGVVLLEVLTNRRALDESLEEGLAIWAQNLIKQGKVTQIIDSRLRDHISKSSLKEFTRMAVQCLHSNPNQRPTMSDIVGRLNLALSLQERKASSTQGGFSIRKVWSLVSLRGHFEPGNAGITRDDQLPAIESLQIVGDAFPGGELQACGYSVNGTTFAMFQWVHRLPDGSTKYIEGAFNPTYTVASDDLGKCLGVETIPMDKNGRKVRLHKCFANHGQPVTPSVENNDPRPSIESLQIHGDAYPGGVLEVCGKPVNGTDKCMFQWFRHLSDGTGEYIEGATNPMYTVTLGDVGTYLGVKIVPMDKNGRRGISVTHFVTTGRLTSETVSAPEGQDDDDIEIEDLLVIDLTNCGGVL